MGSFFNMDSPVMRFLSRLCDLMILNILCLICCIPIVTIGASITALYSVTLKMVKGEDSYIAKGFFKGFRQNFKISTIIWLILLVIGALLAFDFRAANMLPASFQNIFRVLVGAFITFYILLFSYIFPYIARFENTVKQTLKNGFLLMVRHLPWALLLLVILIVSALSIYIIPILLVIIPAVVSLVFDFILERLFRRYMSPEDLEREKENDMYAS